MCAGALTACAPVARDTRLSWGDWLLPPDALGSSVRAIQQLHIVSGDQSWLVLSVLDVSPRSLTLVGLSGFGRRVITLRYDGVELNEEHHPRVPEELEGRRILRELQLVYWPRDAVLGALPPDWHVEETGRERVLRYAGWTVVHIHCEGEDRWQGHCMYEDLHSGYRLAIDSQVEAP